MRLELHRGRVPPVRPRQPGSGGARVGEHAARAVPGERRPHHQELRPEGGRAAAAAAGAALCHREHALGLHGSPAERVHPARVQRQDRIAGEQTLVEPAEPRLDRRQAAAGRQRQGERVDEVDHAFDVPGRVGVLERGLQVAALLVPRGRAPVERGRQLRLEGHQLALEEISEETVDPEPPGPPLDREQEEVRPRDPGEGRLRTGLVQHCVAERRGELGQHSGPAQEPQLGRTQVREARRSQVVGQVAVRARDRGRRP
jgi:hypothetical protein